jgi:hypothetical protein
MVRCDTAPVARPNRVGRLERMAFTISKVPDVDDQA